MTTQKTKALSQRNVEELKKIFEDFGLPLPEDANKKELVLELGRHGIDNRRLKAFEEKTENKLEVDYDNLESPVEVEGDVVVCMTRRNPSFGWDKYIFGGDRRFVPMPKDKALELIQAYDGFHIATREEITRYYGAKK